MSKLKAIKCPKCAAPLNLLGGGRVKTITCAYCKSIIDIDNEFQVLGNFRNIKNLHTIPFEIGMKGEIEGIVYTIIGRVNYVELHNEFFWDDLLLFSPLYGYAWLTYEEGHTLLSKRKRDLPNLEWDEMVRAEYFEHNNKKYKVMENYTVKINYIEGELTWVAKKYDKIKIIDLYAPPYGISIENSSNEIEFYSSKYLDNKKVYEAFKVPKEQQIKNNGVHELLEFGKDFFKPLFNASLVAMGFIILMLIFLNIDGKGHTVNRFHSSNLNRITKIFNIDNSKYLTKLTLSTNSKKALNNFNIQLKQKEELLFSINSSNTFLSPKIATTKTIMLPTWEKDAKEVEIYLKLPKGSYSLLVLPVDNNQTSLIDIRIEEDVVRFNYIIWFMATLFTIWIIYFFKRNRYKQQLEDDDEEEESFFGNIFKLIAIFFLYFYVVYDFQWIDFPQTLFTFIFIMFILYPLLNSFIRRF